MTRVAMWSGPRSISTALMRSFENRRDTFVSDEPFYAQYLYETGIDHPLREKVISSGNTDWNSVADNITGPIPEGKDIWYQKHMTQHNLPGKDITWIQKMQNIFLIRHPREVILSYTKKYDITSITQLGYPQQRILFTMLKKSSGGMPLILDARDVLENPEGMLKKLCERLKVPFYKEMLSWPVGRRESDGIWGNHWYASVEASTGFQGYKENNDILPPEQEGLYEVSMEYYQQLYQHRIRVV